MTDPDKIRQDIERTQDSLRDDVNALTEKVSPARVAERRVRAARGAVTNAKEKIMGTASDAGSSVRDTVSSAVSGVGDAASSVADGVGSAASSAGDALATAPDAARQRTAGNPLAAGVIAFGAGWLLSSLLPVARQLQQATRELAENLREPAQQAVESVKSTAGEAASTVAEESGPATEHVTDRAQQARHAVTERTPGTGQSLLDNVGQIAPGGVRDFLRTIIDNAQQQRGTAGVAAVVGLLLALWSASAYVGAFMRASNAIYGVGEGRPVWKTAPVRLAVTVAVMVMLLISAAIVLLTGRVADQVGRALGIGHTAVTVWDIANWPVLLVLVSLTLALLYWACPNVRQPGFRWITPGGLVAVVIWLVASGGFAVYVANFASYNKTYGSVAGVIVFLVWLWISNVAVLLGAEFDAELERQRAVASGVGEDEQFAVPRDTSKLDEDDTRRADALARHRRQP